jgi:hypothetical protein
VFSLSTNWVSNYVYFTNWELICWWTWWHVSVILTRGRLRLKEWVWGQLGIYSETMSQKKRRRERKRKPKPNLFVTISDLASFVVKHVFSHIWLNFQLLINFTSSWNSWHSTCILNCSNKIADDLTLIFVLLNHAFFLFNMGEISICNSIHEVDFCIYSWSSLSPVTKTALVLLTSV